jgi:hypothetical protein
MELTLSTVFDHSIAVAWDGLAVRRAENTGDGTRTSS